ncbi:MAG: ABC transporter permease, partial [Acidobacteriota bacterium]
MIAEFNTAVAGQEWPFWLDIELDGQALAFVLFCTLASACISGFIPAWRGSRLNVWGVLKEESRGQRRNRLGPGLVIAEVALSSTLLVGAVLMVRTLVNLSAVEFEFDTERVYAGRVTLLASAYPGWEELDAAWSEIERRLESEPLVSAAAAADRAPGFEWAGMKRYAVDGDIFDKAQSQPAARRVRVTPGFFDTLDVGPLAGRLLRASDRRDAEPVAVINQSLAERHWPGGQAVGQSLRVGDASSQQPWRTIVGVVPDLHAGGPSDQSPEAFYLPFEQSMTRSAVLLVKTRGPLADAVLPIRDAMARFNADVPVYFGGALEQKIHEQLFFYRMVGSIFGLFADTALLLAATG